MKNRMIQTFEGKREIRHVANCVSCSGDLWVFVDGDCAGSSGDPRGAIKEFHNYDPFVAEEYSMEGPDVPACWGCCNDSKSYQLGLAIAKARWRVKNED